jgi:hypothetical protein
MNSYKLSSKTYYFFLSSNAYLSELAMIDLLAGLISLTLDRIFESYFGLNLAMYPMLSASKCLFVSRSFS